MGCGCSPKTHVEKAGVGCGCWEAEQPRGTHEAHPPVGGPATGYTSWRSNELLLICWSAHSGAWPGASAAAATCTSAGEGSRAAWHSAAEEEEEGLRREEQGGTYLAMEVGFFFLAGTATVKTPMGECYLQ